MPTRVSQTCPDINYTQGIIKGLIRDIPGYVDDVDAKNSIVFELRNVHDMLEELRESNSALRKWAEEAESELNDVLNAQD